MFNTQLTDLADLSDALLPIWYQTTYNVLLYSSKSVNWASERFELEYSITIMITQNIGLCFRKLVMHMYIYHSNQLNQLFWKQRFDSISMTSHEESWLGLAKKDNLQNLLILHQQTLEVLLLIPTW